MAVIERLAYPLTEAQALLGGISRGTLYNMRDRGEIRLVKLGRRTLVPADELRRLIEGDEDSLVQALPASLTLLVDSSANGNAPATNRSVSQTFDDTERHGSE